MKGTQPILSMNRGIMSRLALARTDLKRTAVSASIQENWSPRKLGPMMLRPGMGYIAPLYSDVNARLIPFIFSTTDTALIEISSASRMRVLVNDAVITRTAMTAIITNGNFTTDLSGWTDADEAGAVSAWVTGGGFMGLTGTGPNAAIRYQQVTLTQSGVVHGLRIRVSRGPIQFRVGSTAGGAEYLAETSLGVGEHSITFAPTTNFFIQFSNRTTNTVLLDSVAFDPGGALELVSPWDLADLDNIRYYQSGDVVFIATSGMKQYQIERRDGGSWSIVEYQTTDGPFRVINTTRTTLTPSALTGSIGITASTPVFRSTNVGSLYKITSQGQTVTDAFSSDNDFSNTISVTGVGETRRFNFTISGTFVATVTIQRSFDDGSSWLDVVSYTTAQSSSYIDGLDNAVALYRIGVKTGDYTSGTANCTLVYSSGTISGVVRVTNYASETSVVADVLTDLGGTAATPLWAEGDWSPRRGYPSAVAIHDGRLFWAGKDRVWGSVTDAFTSFSTDVIGDAGPISRSIGFGPVDNINWLLSMNRLMAGTAASELSFRSSSLDEPLTPTNFTPKESSTQGSSAVQAVKVDEFGLFVQRCGSRLYKLAFDAYGMSSTEDLSIFVPELCAAGIVRVSVQRQPETRVHCVLGDGTCAVVVFDPAENLLCWWLHVTDGDIKDVAVLPGTQEDSVYYIVDRDGAYGFEKLALESEAHGAAVNKIADAFVYAAGASTTITGLSHLEGRDVVTWGNGKSQGTLTVSGGSVTLPESCTDRCAGLPYQARFKSMKLAYVVEPGGAGLTQTKRINSIAPLMLDTHARGLQFGPDFDTLSYMPEVERGAVIDLDSIWDEYDAPSTPFQGKWDTDSRLCLVANAPLPCTVSGIIIDMSSH
jgi:hypothetical protein